MALHLDLCGIELDFAIRDYAPSIDNDSFTKWCNVDFHIRSGDWLNYQVDGELLMHGEVDEILSRIDAILNGDVGEPSFWACMEPDFCFTFYPQKAIAKDSKFAYVAPGHEIEDIKLEWDVYFWNGRLPRNRLTLVLTRKDIVALQQYLLPVVA